MATPVKFLFETSFDTPSPLQEEIEAAEKLAMEAVAPEVYSAADLDAAKQQGYAQGLAAGAEQTGAAIDAQVLRLLDQIGAQMDGLVEDARNSQELAARDSTEMALAIAKKLSAVLISKAPMAGMETMIKTCLGEQYAEPKIVVRVADQMIEPMKQRLDALTRQSGYMGDVVLIADETFDQSKCRVEWADGGAERNPQVLEQTIDSAVRDFIEASFPEYGDTPAPEAVNTDEQTTPDPALGDAVNLAEPNEPNEPND